MRKLLSILLLVQMKRIQLCLSLDIIRGPQDKFPLNISSSVEDIDSKSCDKDGGYCTCDKNALYNTFIYDSTSSTGRCVTDENILFYNPFPSGCYMFYGTSPMVLLHEDVPCATVVENGCRVQFRLFAPSHVQHQSCKLQKKKSQYSVYGHTWLPLKVQPGELSLNNDRLNTKFLKIANITSLLSKWPGNLLRLQIKCSSRRSFESHCVLLKIAGSPENIPSVSTTSSTSTSTSSSTSLNISPTTSSTTTSIQDNKTKDSNNLNQESDKDSSTLISIVVPIAVLLCLLIVVIGIVLYRRRQRPQEQSVHANETTNRDTQSRTLAEATDNENNHSPTTGVGIQSHDYENTLEACYEVPSSPYVVPASPYVVPASPYQALMDNRRDSSAEHAYQELRIYQALMDNRRDSSAGHAYQELVSLREK